MCVFVVSCDVLFVFLFFFSLFFLASSRFSFSYSCNCPVGLSLLWIVDGMRENGESEC